MDLLYKTICYLIFGLIILIKANAQIIDVKKYAIENKSDFFNEKFIRSNSVKNIQAEIFYKKELKPMQSSNLTEQYFFNNDGNLKKHIATNKISGNKIDTTVIYFQYINDVLSKEIQLDSKGFFSHAYERDDNGLIIKDTYAREENKGYSRFNFIQGKSVEIFFESFTYLIDNGKIMKKRIANSDGKPYNEITYDYDNFDNLIKETSTLIVTKKSRFKEYKYNEYHQLIEKKEVSNFFGNSTIIHNYTYDEIGRAHV